MKGNLFDEPEGATPLGPDDAEGLIPTWVATRGDLNVAEQENIAEAVAWASSATGPRAVGALLTEAMMRELHRRMFGDVWKWAGKYRRRDTNIGVHWPNVPERVCALVADVAAQVTDTGALPWPADELAVRFHHRLVQIHPFPNGNGRHARLAADILVTLLGEAPFTWGVGDLDMQGVVRGTYLDALRTADANSEYGPLVMFARS